MWNKTLIKPLGKCRMLLSNPKPETSHGVEFIVFTDNDDCQSILGLQTSEQMHLENILDSNFDRVAAVQHDSCFNSVFGDKLGEWPGVQHLTVDPEVDSRLISLAIRPRHTGRTRATDSHGCRCSCGWSDTMGQSSDSCEEEIRRIKGGHRPSGTQQDIVAWALHITKFRRCPTWAARSNCFLEGRPLAWLRAHQVWYESGLLTMFQTCFGRYRWCHLSFGTTVLLLLLLLLLILLLLLLLLCINIKWLILHSNSLLICVLCHNIACFLCQHIVFLFKFVIATTIPDIPSEVTLQTRKVTQQSQTDRGHKGGVQTFTKSKNHRVLHIGSLQTTSCYMCRCWDLLLPVKIVLL